MGKDMTTKFTPGPWLVSTYRPNGRPIVGARGVMIAMLAHTINLPDQKESALANAALIAAAPDLLMALQDLADDIADRFDMDSESTNPRIKSCIGAALDAIAKARGVQ
jgi:hypothetical protein